MKPLPILRWLALAMLLASTGAAAQVAKVVWHVDFADARRLSAMIQNVNNMVTTYQGNLDDYDVRIVFLAGGIRFLTTDPLKGTPFEEDAAFPRGARRPDHAPAAAADAPPGEARALRDHARAAQPAQGENRRGRRPGALGRGAHRRAAGEGLRLPEGGVTQAIAW
jgi:hypothetical protein